MLRRDATFPEWLLHPERVSSPAHGNGSIEPSGSVEVLSNKDLENQAEQKRNGSGGGAEQPETGSEEPEKRLN